MPAIAVLWIDFVREIRWCWEESERLPRMRISSSIDLSSCLIHQKLQMVHQYPPCGSILFYEIVIIREKWYLFFRLLLGAWYASLMDLKKNTCIKVNKKNLTCLCLHWAHLAHNVSSALLPCRDGNLWRGPCHASVVVLGLHNGNSKAYGHSNVSAIMSLPLHQPSLRCCPCIMLLVAKKSGHITLWISNFIW